MLLAQPGLWGRLVPLVCRGRRALRAKRGRLVLPVLLALRGLRVRKA